MYAAATHTTTLNHFGTLNDDHDNDSQSSLKHPPDIDDHLDYTNTNDRPPSGHTTSDISYDEDDPPVNTSNGPSIQQQLSAILSVLQTHTTCLQETGLLPGPNIQLKHIQVKFH